MAYKKLSEATLVESVAEEATMLIEENDEIKRASVKDTMEKYGMSDCGGGGGSFIFKIERMDSYTCNILYKDKTIRIEKDDADNEYYPVTNDRENYDNFITELKNTLSELKNNILFMVNDELGNSYYCANITFNNNWINVYYGDKHYNVKFHIYQ